MTCDSYQPGSANYNYCSDTGTGSDTRQACVACAAQCRGSPACTSTAQMPTSGSQPTKQPTKQPTTPPTNSAGWVGYGGSTCSDYTQGSQYYTYCGDRGMGSDTRPACVACASQCRGSPACAAVQGVAVVAAPSPGPSPSQSKQGCADLSDYAAMCPGWATGGECTRSPEFMRWYCKSSCGLCGSGLRSGGSADYLKGVQDDCDRVTFQSDLLVCFVEAGPNRGQYRYTKDANDWWWALDQPGDSRRSAVNSPIPSAGGFDSVGGFGMNKQNAPISTFVPASFSRERDSIFSSNTQGYDSNPFTFQSYTPPGRWR